MTVSGPWRSETSSAGLLDCFQEAIEFMDLQGATQPDRNKNRKKPRNQWQQFATGSPGQKKTKKKHATRHKLIQSTIYNPMLSNAITCNSIQHSKKFRQKKWEIRGGSQEPMAAICHGISRPEKIEETEETRNKLHDTHKN
jgi:hypothetical protein